MSQLRVALATRGVPTRDDDVRELRGCYSTLSLGGGLAVRCGPEFFRWYSWPAKAWQWHSVTDPTGAAYRLAAMLREHEASNLIFALCTGPGRASITSSPSHRRGQR